MDNMPHIGDIISPGDPGLPHAAMTYPEAFFRQFRTGSSVYGAADTAAGQQLLIGGVDNAVPIQGGDVFLDIIYHCGKFYFSSTIFLVLKKRYPEFAARPLVCNV